MNLNEMYPRKYASGSDLDHPVTLTIDHIVKDQMRPNPKAKPESKYVIYFAKATKGVILSPTLARQICTAIGADPEDDTSTWAGKRVTLYPLNMTVAGVDRIAIRARAAAATNGVGDPPAALQDEEDIPAA
jgi:hypothetical protein